LKDVIIDLNAELDGLGDDFDYRGKLRDEAWIKKTATGLVAEYTKLVSRGRIESFSTDYSSKTVRKQREKL
jgi:hypothetical protein